MPEGEGHHAAAHGLKGFLSAQTGPLPNWAWLVVVVGGIAAAIIVPRFINKSSTNQADQTSTGTGTGASGLGLAIDPTTGLPYAVEGLVPSGGTVGMAPGQLPPIQNPAPVQAPTAPTTPTPTPTPTPTQGYNPFEPIIPPGKYNGPSYSNLRWGTKYTYNGVLYQLGTGGGGRLWGVPVKQGQTLSQAQWNNVPIAQGQKVLLTEPTSAYPVLPVPTATNSPWNGQTQMRLQ